jgi:RND family efflux transporter MFP subunit
MMRSTVVAILVLAGVVAAQTMERAFAHAEPRTAVRAPTAATRTVRAEGKVVPRPGAEVVVGTETGGLVARVLVAEGASVKKDQLLAEIDSTERQAELAEAHARIAAAEAEATFAKVELERFGELRRANVASSESLERAQRDLRAAVARAEGARAAARRLEIAVAKTKIAAPIDGVITARFVHPGEIASAGAPVVRVTDLSKVRVEAEVDEYDAARLALGASARVTAEGYDASFSGRVEEIPAHVVSRQLRLQDPGQPSDMRVLIVKVALEEATPLKLGQRIEVEIGGRPVAN